MSMNGSNQKEVFAVIVPESGIPYVLDSRGTTLCDLNALLANGCHVEQSVAMERAVVLIIGNNS
jgi:hypothetical protein